MVNFISLKTIIDRLMRNPMMRDLDFEKAVDDTVDFLEILRIPVTLVDKMFEGHVCDFRLELPCDIGYIKQVLVNHVPARNATDTFHIHYHCIGEAGEMGKAGQIWGIHNYPFSFNYQDDTFTVQDGYLFTSLKECDVKIAYMGIKTDDEGYPMIPDHRAFINALEKYVEQKYLRIQWQNGRVTDKVYEEAKQEYSWAVGQCETAMRSLDLSKMEGMMNMWQSLLINQNHFSSRFRELGSKQLIKKQ